VDVYIHSSVTQSPSDNPAYGRFRLDYIGKSSGTGTMTTWDDLQKATVTFNFCHDSDETAYGFPAGDFRRLNISAGFDACFDRTKANASSSVWRYGTYNANDGERVDQANPGYPVLATYGGNSYYPMQETLIANNLCESR
jgi:hypothetical protein